MTAIIIDNAECQIIDMTVEDYRVLKNLMSYSLPNRHNYFSRGYINQKKYLIDKKGRFPTGLLPLFYAFTQSNNSVFKIIDNRREPRPLVEFPAPSFRVALYKEQIEAAEAARALKRGIISMPTGTGKSKVIELIISLLKVKTLVVVPSLELKKQLWESISHTWPTITNKFITIENVDALDPNKPGDYDCVIIDEFHHSGAATYRQLNKKAWKDVYYRFGLTATPFRSRDHEQILLESVLSEVIYKLDYSVAIQKNYIAPLEVIEVDVTKNSSASKLNKWTAVNSKLIIENYELNAKIALVAKVLYLAGKSVLVLVKQLRQGDFIKELLSKENLTVMFANGKSADSNIFIRDFSSGLSKILIASSIVGEGIDTKAAEYVILAGGTGRSKISIMQNCGRVLRKYEGKTSGKVIIFKDTSHKWLREHYREFRKIVLEEYGIAEPSKLNVDISFLLGQTKK